jgi:hypothetical protein
MDGEKPFYPFAKTESILLQVMAKNKMCSISHLL